jgi:hypothetical protein
LSLEANGWEPGGDAPPPYPFQGETMTEIDYLQRIAFLLHIVALASCWIAGTTSIKFIIYIKNHRDLW